VVKVDAEWFQVFCREKEDFYVQNVKKAETVDRLRAQAKQRTVEPMNLIVVMMDTVSRAQVFRKMESLTATLEHLNNTNSFEVFQFFRIISNGFNTEYNTRAMYTGSQLRRERNGRPYWDFMRGQGNVSLYINGFCEDWMSTFIKKVYEGLDHTVFFPWCHFEYHPLTKTFGNFGGPFSILRRCINGKHVHKHVLDYVRQYWKNYNEFGKIVHIPFQEGHEGTGEVIRTLDPDLAGFIRELEATGELEKTVIVLTSDHGSHMGPYFMATEMGEFEQKLPLLFMIYPKWFLDKYPEFRQNLRDNEQKLVVHYDTHWTLRHLATLPEFGGEIVENRSREASTHTELWDCEKNLKYMEAIYSFRDKKFKKNFPASNQNELYHRIEICFRRLNHTVSFLDNLSSVPMSEIKDLNSEDDNTKNYVSDVILDIGAKYWFEDTIQDRTNKKSRNTWHSGLDEQEVEKNLQAEEEAWNTLRAPGRGRYVFGRSLMKYSDDRDCSEAGIAKCICNTKSKSSLRAVDP
jgi:hypothetical protein